MWKKILKAFLFPHIAVLLLLLPISVAFLVYSMTQLGTESVWSIISYVLSAYTLTIWCFKIPAIIAWVKRMKSENKYVVRYLSDERLRVNISLFISLLLNAVYAPLQLGLGIFHGSFWYYSMAWYYISMCILRYSLIRYTHKREAGADMLLENKKYRMCGIILLIMNVALTGLIALSIYSDRDFSHHEITTIALAAYTFASLTMAIISLIKYRKHNSPVYMASKITSLAAACVSMLTLEATMLTTFGGEEMNELTKHIFLGASGGAISIFIIVMAVYIIITANKKINLLKDKTNGTE